jgi:DNA polymerase III delta prime subunit
MDERLIVQIICDKEVGTAFYVASDLLLTAYHTISSFKEDGNNIIKDIQDGELRFELVNNYIDFDISVLKVTGRSSKGYYGLQAHHNRIGEACVSFGYPDKLSNSGLRLNGEITQKIFDSPADYRLSTKDVDDLYNYQGMSGAPVLIDNKVIGIIIEQAGNQLSIISTEKLAGILTDVEIDKDIRIDTIPVSIAKDIETVRPNYSVFDKLESALVAEKFHWILLYGSPGCGKTTIAAGFEPENEKLEILGRFFFKVANDEISRAVRCSEGFFVDWIESLYITKSGSDLEKLTFEEKRKRISGWLRDMNDDLANKGNFGVIIIDGLDELSTDKGNNVDDILSLLPDNLSNIKFVLSCITEEIIPASIIGKLNIEGKIEVTPLNIALCESYIHDNSGDWEKPYSFIQAVANKTEGHPLYMNYLCRYIAESFDETTQTEQLDEWVEKLPAIDGDIRSYYEAVWKKANPQGCVFEVLALLSQIRGSVVESQLIGMMRNPNPFEFKASTSEFRHLLKEKETDRYEIYHSSFRLFVTDKLASIITYTNDQIVKYCKVNKGLTYSIENTLHHVVNGSDTEKGLTMCNQEWADNCALHDVSPDLIMHDIRECLSIAVDCGLAVEVIRLMLLAQRIENRCDLIMVNNVNAFVDLNILQGKPDVALKYIVRDNILLVNLQNAMIYLRLMLELGYNEQASNLSNSIDAAIRKTLRDTSEKGIDPYIFVTKGFLIVEGVLAGVENPNNMIRYLNHTLSLLKADNDESSDKIIMSIRDIIIAYQLSNQVRAGKRINTERHIKEFNATWNERVVMLLIKVMALYEEQETGLHKIGYNEAFKDCLKQVEKVLLHNDFSFFGDNLEIILNVLIDKPIRAEILKKLLISYNPTPEAFVFRDINGVDIDVKSLLNFYNESLYKAYIDEALSLPSLNKKYNDGLSWDKYVEALISRTAYLNGVIYRMRAIGEDYSEIYARFKEILDHIDFSFERRTQWKRSYLLPEELFPFLYDKLAEIYRDFFVDKIDDFMKHIKSRMPDQMCLYREGYCAILIRVSGILGEKSNTQKQALFLADEAVKFILYAVQNRSERCSYLLQICREYAMMGEKTKAQSTYLEVLNSSMGPDWYKEAQLDLINEFRKTDTSFDAAQVAHMAAIFEEASGEMTFQRYVQQEKNEFVATIAKASSLSDAIAYHKFETIPSSERIISNAEDWKVDMPVPGNGYDLGANHLIEASAICQLLRECRKVSPYIKYAISELFWENWDKMHNDHQYANLHSEIIAELGEEKSIEILAPRMADYIAHIYDTKKGVYLKDFEETVTSDTFGDRLNYFLGKWGIEWKRSLKEERHSEERDTLKERLGSLPSSKALLNNMRKNIVSPLGSYWYSLSEFITPLINKSDFDKTKLFGIISGHYDINVRPSMQQFEKFTWMEGSHEENNQDEQMIHFLIWFLIHPDRNVSMRTEEALKWLCEYDHRVIKCLIEEIKQYVEIGLNTIASEVLLEIALEKPFIVLEFIQSDDEQKALLNVRSYSVSRNLYEIALVLSEKCGYNSLLEKMKTIFPDKIADRSDVLIDFEDMMLVEQKIDKLNNLQVTGRKEFAQPYLDTVHSLKNDGTITRLFKADEYIRRSFYLNGLSKGRYIRTMEDVLDRVLYGKVDYERARRVYYAIND